MCPASGGFTVWMPWAEEGLREKWSESMVNPDPLPPGSGAPYRPVPTLGEIWGGCAGRHRWGHMSLKSTGWSARWSAGSRSGPHLENSRWPSPPTNKAAVQSNPGGQSTNNAQRFVYVYTHEHVFLFNHCCHCLVNCLRRRSIYIYKSQHTMIWLQAMCWLFPYNVLSAREVFTCVLLENTSRWAETSRRRTLPPGGCLWFSTPPGWGWRGTYIVMVTEKLRCCCWDHYQTGVPRKHPLRNHPPPWQHTWRTF